MKPGEGKGHRGCAVRCIAGGVPPMLVVRDRSGGQRLFVIAGAAGDSCGEPILPFVGDEVEVTGEFTGLGDLDVIAMSQVKRVE
jgi:hypothetical protein